MAKTQTKADKMRILAQAMSTGGETILDELVRRYDIEVDYSESKKQFVCEITTDPGAIGWGKTVQSAVLAAAAVMEGKGK